MRWWVFGVFCIVFPQLCLADPLNLSCNAFPDAASCTAAGYPQLLYGLTGAPLGGYLVYNYTDVNAPHFNRIICCTTNIPDEGVSGNCDKGSLREITLETAYAKINGVASSNYVLNRTTAVGDNPNYHVTGHLCMYGTDRNVSCTYVPNEGDCIAAGYDTSLGYINATYTAGNSPPADSPGPVLFPANEPPSKRFFNPASYSSVCCRINTLNPYFDNISVQPHCAGQDKNLCEVGEYVEMNATYIPDSFVGDVWIYWNSTNATIPNSCNISKKSGTIIGMRFPCSGSPCSINWTIWDIPPACAFNNMSAYWVEFWKPAVIAKSVFSTSLKSNFTFGPHIDYSGSIQAESNASILSPPSYNFTNSNYSLPAHMGYIPVPWWIRQFSATTNMVFCEDKTRYLNAHGLNNPPWQSIIQDGGCESNKANDPTVWYVKPLPRSFNVTMPVYLTLTGVYGPDSQTNENTIIQVLDKNNQVKYAWTITDTWNSTNPASLHTKVGTYDYEYANCTLTNPDQEGLPVILDPTDKINISTPKDPYLLDSITLTSTHPNNPNCTNTDMKCGRFTDKENPPTIIGKTCNVTTPLPQRAMCQNYDGIYADCVYGAESGNNSPSTQCYSQLYGMDGNVIFNENGQRIWCASLGYGNWCPLEFNWNPARNRCEPTNQYICDWGMSGNTQHHCDNTSGKTYPGFYNDRPYCLNNFDGLPEEGPTWNKACCQFLSVPEQGGNYLFFDQEDVNIY